MNDSNTLYFVAVMAVVALITAAITVRTIEYADKKWQPSTSQN